MQLVSFVVPCVRDGKKAQPLVLHAVGGRHIFGQDREVEDHVYCTIEFPRRDMKTHSMWAMKILVPVLVKGPVADWVNDNNKKIVVTYSSINGNGYGGYGEVVTWVPRDLVLEREYEVMLYGARAQLRR